MDNAAPWAEAAIKAARPLSLDYFHGSMYDAIVAAADQLRDQSVHMAIYTPTGKISSQAFLRETDRCADALSARGIQSGEIVSIALPNSPEALWALYGANKLGTVANIVHPLTGVSELASILKSTKSRLLFTTDAIADQLQSNSTSDLPLIITVEDYKKPRQRPLSSLREIFKRGNGYRRLSWSSFIKSGKKKTQRHHGRDEDTAVILYSGGTTGAPKGIELMNYNLNAMAKNITACNADALAGENPVITAILPIFHGFGLGVCVHAALCSNVGMLLMPSFSAKSFAEILKTVKPTVLAGVPAFYEELLRMRSIQSMDLSFVRQVYCGGEKVSLKTIEDFDRLLAQNGSAAVLCEGYGMAETLAVATLNPAAMRKAGSAGIPISDTRIQIADTASGIELPVGETGEIRISGPSVMKGYYQNERETENSFFVDSDGTRWLLTGDLGYLDEDGFLFIVDRKKRMIILNGYNVYPSRIEGLIRTCPGIKDCAVYEEQQGEKKYLSAALVPDSETYDEASLRELVHVRLKENLAAYEQPQRIVFRNSIPKTAIGKTAYSELIETRN